MSTHIDQLLTLAQFKGMSPEKVREMLHDNAAALHLTEEEVARCLIKSMKELGLHPTMPHLDFERK